MADPKVSGQITVSSAGTAVKGPRVGPGTFLIKGMGSNTGAYVYIGNDGSDDVSSTTGYSLASGEQCLITVSDLSQVWFDVTTNGDKICWFRMEPGILGG